MSLQDRRWYPYFAGIVMLVFWLVLAALPTDYPAWRQGLLFGVLAAVLTAWTEGLRRDRRMWGQDERRTPVTRVRPSAASATTKVKAWMSKQHEVPWPGCWPCGTRHYPRSA